MRYYVITDTTHIDKFSRYDVVDLKTCRKQNVGGKTILDNPQDYSMNSGLFKNYDFESQSYKVSVTDKSVLIYYRKMSYILTNAIIRYIYIQDEKAHLGIEGVDGECIIDFYSERFMNCGECKYMCYEADLFLERLPARLQKALVAV